MRLKRGYNTKYTKYSSNSQRPLMKHDKGVKIWPISALIKVEKQNLNKLINHAKMGTKEGYNGKWYMEVPNSGEPFFNVEEGLKISLLTVYIMLQNRLHMGQNYYAK